MFSFEDIMMSTGTEIYGPSSFVVHVNGLIIGITRFPARFVAQFRKLRRAGKINEFVGIYINHHHKTVNIASDGGRICRPLIIVENLRSRVTSEHIQVRSSPTRIFHLPCLTSLNSQTAFEEQKAHVRRLPPPRPNRIRRRKRRKRLPHSPL